MVVTVYDIDDGAKLHDLSKQQKIGEFQFTLGKVASARDQEISGKLEGTSSTVKIMGSQKKAGYGSNEAQFVIEYSPNGTVFCTINKMKGRGKFHPVYKTEVLPSPHRYEVRIELTL